MLNGEGGTLKQYIYIYIYTCTVYYATLLWLSITKWNRFKLQCDVLEFNAEQKHSYVV
jgi:hypothetical protein